MPAVRQIICAKAKGLQQGEEEELIKKIGETARRSVVFIEKHTLTCLHSFDSSGQGEMSDREVFNVLKMLKVDCRQEEVRVQLYYTIAMKIYFTWF